MGGSQQDDANRWASAWRAGSSRLASGAPVSGDVAIVGIAGLLMSAGTVLLVSSLGDTPLVTLSFNAFMNIGLAAGAVYGALVLRRSFDRDWLRWQVAAWYIGGICFIYLLYTWASLPDLLSGAASLRELVGGYVLFGNLGGILGLVAGFNRGRAAQNRRLVDELESKNDTLEFVNYMLRHDVLNGAQTIQGYTSLLDETLDTEGEAREYIANIRAGNRRITDLVENVRVLMDTVSGESHRTTVDLSDLVETEVAHARDQFPEATFETEIEPDVEAVANSTFRAVVANLLQNAVEHNDADVPTVSVTVTTGTESVALRVADNGPGFPDGMAVNARQPGETDPTDRGMGMGLYLVEILVGAVDGSVSIVDNEPRGAVVTVELNPPAEYSPR